jgi:hypothetical protein
VPFLPRRSRPLPTGTLLCFLVPVPLLTLTQLPDHLKLFVVAVREVLKSDPGLKSMLSRSHMHTAKAQYIPLIELAYTATEKDGRRIDGCYPADQRPVEVILEDILVELREMGRDINASFIAVGVPSLCFSCFQ